MPLNIFGLELNKFGYMKVHGSEELNLHDNFTISFNVQLWDSNEAGLRDLINKTDGTDWKKATFRIGYVYKTTYGLLTLIRGDGTTNQFISIGNLYFNKKYHITIVVKDGTVYKYINGNYVGSTDYDFNTYYTSSSPIHIGICTGGSRANVPRAFISDVLIYNRPLSEDEVSYIYSNPRNPIQDGLIIWYPLEDHCVFNAVDPSKYSGILNNVGFAKKFTDGAMFQLDNSYISCPYINLSKDFTMYVEFVPMSSMGNYGRLICVGYNERAINLEAQFGGNNRCTLEIIDKDGNHALAEASIPWIQNTVNTVCVVKSKDNVTMYINGVKDNNLSIKLNGSVTSNDIFDLDMSYYTSGTRIGRALNLQEQYYGAMRNVMIWDTSLDESEVYSVLCDPIHPPSYDTLQLWLPLKDKYGIYARDFSKNKYTCTLNNVRWLS